MIDTSLNKQTVIDALKICDAKYDNINCDKCSDKIKDWNSLRKDENKSYTEELMRLFDKKGT